MFGRMMTALWAALLVACMAAGAQAQEGLRCGPRAEIIKMLWGKYREFIHAAGTINDQSLMETFKSHKGTWTIVITISGKSCILAAGENWDELPDQPELPGKGI